MKKLRILMMVLEIGQKFLRVHCPKQAKLVRFSLFVFHFSLCLLPSLLLAQNDTIAPKKTQWLSDSLFSTVDSIPAKKDSLLVKKDSLPEKTKEKKNVPSIFSHIKTIQVVGISDTKTAKRIQAEAKNAQDSIVLKNKMEAWTEQLKKKGRKACNFERFEIKNKELFLYFYEGKQYFFGEIKLENLPSTYIQKYGIDKLTEKREFSNPILLASKLQNVLGDYQNTGYPFANFSQLQVNYAKKGQDSILENIHYSFNAEKKFTIDSIIFEGRHRESNRFLYSLIRLSPQDAYNQAYIDNIQKILNSTIYYKNVKSPKIEFNYLGQSKLRIKLEAKRANKFDVLLGILPATNTSTTGTPDQRFQWTGMLDVTLVSMFKYGETLQLKYDKLTQTSRKINLKANLPYLFHLPLHINGEGELFRQNTDFQNLYAKIGIEYGITPFLFTKFQYKTRKTTLGDSFVQDVLAGKQKLQILDGSQNTYTGGFRYENLDYKFNPTNGIYSTLDLGIGKTIIKKNINLSSSVYDSLSINRENETRWSLPMKEIDFVLKVYKKFGKRTVMYLANRTYWLDQKRIFKNDQIQLGGSKTIRGFNENQFFSNRFTYFTAEYRLLLTQNTYLFGFGDYGILKDDATHQNYNPVGVGLGLTYDTPAGVVSFSYAVGKVGDIPFQPTRGKIHVGLVSQF